MIEDYFKISFKNLKKRKTRSLLTITGIVIAIFTIFVLMSLSLGLNEFVNEQFEMLGTDKFFIQPKGTFGGMPGTDRAVELTTKDAEIVEKVKGIDKAVYMTVGNVKIEFKDKKRYYIVIGVPSDSDLIELFFESMNLGVDEGRFLKKGDKKKIMIGYNYKYKELFDKPVRTGDKIELNDVEFEVIGIVEQIGNPGDDQQVYISFEDYKELYDSGEVIDLIYAQIKPGEDIIEVADRTERKLMNYRDVDEKTIDFTVSTPEEYLEIFGDVLNVLTAFLVGIGAISLIVGGIGIANTMYTSVLERKKEIGTMKAIGAKNSDILGIFVTESGLLGLVGGALGLIIGILIVKSVEYGVTIYLGSNMLRASMNPFLIIGSLMFAFLIGVVSGFFPAFQASKLKPVDALRYE